MPVTLTRIRSLSDFQPAYRWEMRIPALGLLGEVLGLGQEDLNLRCVSADLPTLSNQEVEVTVQGHRITRPGPADYGGEVTLTFVETVDPKVLPFFYYWQQLAWVAGLGAQLPSEAYLLQVHLILLDGLGRGTQQFTLFDCWVGSTNFGSLDSESADVQRPEVTLKYDYFVWLPLGSVP